jgi:hypothetical protein
MREIKLKGNTVLAMTRHQIFAWDLRATSSPALTVTKQEGIVDCLEFDGRNTVICNTADEVKFFGISIWKVLALTNYKILNIIIIINNN